MKKRIKIYAVIAGVVLLLSGFGKALAMADFSTLIGRYGWPWPLFAAIGVVLVETLLGLSLFFQLQLRRAALAAIGLLAGVTLVFAYGHFFINVDDCGCFGAFSSLDMAPVYVFLRNAVLLYLLIDIYLNSKGIMGNITFVERAAFLAMMCIITFFAGYTSNLEDLTFGQGKKYEGKMVHNTKLGKFITTSADSTYFVFVFSYTCAHCLNSIENLKQYEASGVVDKVVAFAFSGTGAEERFFRLFEPAFTVRNYDPSKLFELTSSFPCGYYVRNNMVQLEITGELPCSYVLAKMLDSSDSQ